MKDVYVAGVSMTHFGRQLEKSTKDLVAEAIGAGCADAQCLSTDIEAVFYGNCVQGHMEGQDMIRGEIALRSIGIQGVPVVNVENACATASTAFHLAAMYVQSGAADVVLAVGVEKMCSPNKAKMFGAFDGAWDVHAVDANRDNLLAMGQGVEVPAGTTSDKPYSVFMDVYAAFARQHMRLYGTTQRQFACVSAKNHCHSVENPRAQFRMPYTTESVLDAPPIAYPLTLPMCSPISDGAATAIVCNAQGLEKLGAASTRSIRVLASVIQTGSDRSIDDMQLHVGRRCSSRAYEQANVGPADIQVAEVHDATAVGEIIETEVLGLVPEGEGGPAAERGETQIGGRIPVNPSGGLESKGHPIGATGLGQLFELVTQLRDEAGKRQIPNVRHAIAQNGGGVVGVEDAVSVVTILGRR